MTILEEILYVILLLFILFPAPSTADIQNMKIRSDKRGKILFSKFGFSHPGYVSVAVSSVSVTSPFPLPQPDPSRMGFMLLSHDLIDEYNQEFQRNHALCPLDNKFIKVLFTFQDLSSPPQSSFNISYHVTYPSVCSLYFVNCNLSCVTMDVHTELYNTNDDGTTKNYLSAGQTQHPSLIFSFSYLCFLGIWILVCFKYWRSLHMVHVLMGVFLVISFLNFVVVAVDNLYVKDTGTSHGWDIFVYIFQFMRIELLFTVIVLTGFGWGFFKPRLHVLEILVLMIVILLQVWANVSTINVEETGPYNKDKVHWAVSSIFAEFICSFVITLPMACSVSMIHGNAKTAYYLFGVVVIAYSFITWFFRMAPDPFELLPWVVNTTEETCALFLCLVMFYIFKPFDDNDETHWLWGNGNISLGNELPTSSFSFR
ncbi:protein CANDIDATE G-PROTEIN COUPLED RECEPTOR 7 [Lactuca sativa]|uniref:protein CANDIDATE G-PROTEIN COUPLED RECEPTOR 7 n=1 Tax=Lactuca sativa TaxID=4236 RepID=UPI001C691A40|nr:protein CANDIDATE G-PROTEIN COUPLED RECEPTOR 7 [Lactuca sativa]